MSTDAAAAPDLATFVAGLPKAELHVHHVGSASPRIVAELAAAPPGRPGAAATPRHWPASSPSPTSPHFIDVYLTTVGLLRTAEDVRMLTYEVARDLAGANRCATPSSR